MGVQLRIFDDSSTGFDFISASAGGFTMIVSPTGFQYEEETGVIFADPFYGVAWTARGNNLGYDTVTIETLGPALVSDFIGYGAFDSGDVRAIVSGIQKSAFGASTFLNLNFMMENTWDDLFDVGGDRIVLSNHNDVVGAGEGRDNVNGRRGDDVIFGENGNDRLFGGTGGDIIEGGAGKDVIKGQGGSDLLAGGGARDNIFGGNGSDEAFGGGGNDRINGGRGDDLLGGNEGRDTMVGGAGADTFQFIVDLGDRKNRDKIVDFSDDVDSIEIFSNIAIDIGAVLDAAVRGDDGVILDFGGGNVLVVGNVFEADLLRNDILTEVF